MFFSTTDHLELCLCYSFLSLLLDYMHPSIRRDLVDFVPGDKGVNTFFVEGCHNPRALPRGIGHLYKRLSKSIIA